MQAAQEKPMTEDSPVKDMKDIVALCKRRGFIFPASDIYGGINGFWDYGPLGVELKNNLRDLWWKWMVTCPPIGPDGQPVEIVGLDSAIIQNPKAWEASGHVGGFSDPMQTCRQCKKHMRADHIWSLLKESPWVLSFAEVFGESGYSEFLKFDSAKALRWAETKGKKLAPGLALVRNPTVTMSWLAEDLKKQNTQPFADPLAITDILQYMATEQKAKTGLQTPCPHCGGDLTEPRQFNLMFESHTGVLRDESSKVYLRPETAQGIFLNFKNVVDSSRVRIPFGIAQIGKAFRNEVNPRNFIFRSREFEQMEMEWFCHPSEVKLWRDFWFAERQKFWRAIGLTSDNIRMRDHDQDELSHYAKAGLGTADIEYRFPFTAPDFGELEGIAHRCDFDLTQHQAHSKVKLEYLDPVSQEKFMPHVIEPAAGLTRGVLAMICEAYTPDPSRPSGVYLNFHPALAPKKAAILPLTAKDQHPVIATKLYMDLRNDFAVELDIKQNIGKRYARQDEIGTPYCFTIDDQTVDDQTVTVRERNTMKQERIGLDHVAEYLRKNIRAV
jgi:glycyl-tRNA synthetase